MADESVASPSPKAIPAAGTQGRWTLIFTLLLGGTTNQYTDAKYEDQNLYNGLFNGALAWYHYKVLSKEEKALENYRNQP